MAKKKKKKKGSKKVALFVFEILLLLAANAFNPVTFRIIDNNVTMLIIFVYRYSRFLFILFITSLPFCLIKVLF